MPLFRAKTADNIATVERRLGEAREKLATIEAERAERSLESALSDNPGAGLEDINTKVTAQRAVVEGLEIALERANTLERRRVAGAASAAEKARIRAVGQHTAAAKRAAIALREGLEQAIDAYKEAVRAAEKAELLLRPPERLQLMGFGGLRTALGNLVKAELARLNGHDGDTRPIDRFPLLPAGSTPGILLGHGQHVSEIEPIETRVSQLLDLAGLLKSGVALPSVPAEPPAAAPTAKSSPAKRRTAPEAPQYEDIPLPQEVVHALRVIADPADYTPEERNDAWRVASEYQG